MRKLHDTELLNLIPSSLKGDPDVQAAAKSIDQDFLTMVEKTKQLIFFSSLDSLPEEALDLLAFEEHVDFYDPNLPIETKIDLINNAHMLHMFKGTPWAVEYLITTLFDEGKVIEWYEYGGSPYHFRVETNNSSVTNERAEEFIRALNSVIRKSAKLDKVVITQKERMSLFVGGVVHIGDYYSTRQVV